MLRQLAAETTDDQIPGFDHRDEGVQQRGMGDLVERVPEQQPDFEDAFAELADA